MIKMPTTIKAALKKWEEATGRKAGESKVSFLIYHLTVVENLF
jgi:hypothetical protein